MERMIRETVSFTIRKRWWVLGMASVIAGISFYYTLNNLGFDTDTSEMLSPDLPFREAYQKYKNAFPKEINTFLIVIEADIPEFADAATQEFVRRLQTEKSFEHIFVPGGGDFFEKNGLLYLPIGEVEELVDNLAMAQPLISRLNRDMSLRGFMRLFEEAIEKETDGLDQALNSLMNRVQKTIKENLNHQRSPVSWQKLLDGKHSNPETFQRLIVVKANLDFNSLLPASEAIALLKKYSTEVSSTYEENIQVKITGEVALVHEELESVQRGAKFAMIVSIFGVFITMFFAFRSLRLVFITSVILILGLVLTLAFATAAIGHLNMISVAFAVLYIGLGVDYAIHFNLRFKEKILSGESQSEAVLSTACGLGPSLLLCAVSTAVGFYAFIPTAYTGVSELGLISGTGMIISLMITLTILPAFLSIIPPKKWSNNFLSLTNSGVYYRSYLKHMKRFGTLVRWSTMVIVLGSCFLLTSIKFDYDPMNLRDPNSESVSTFKDLEEADDSMLSSITVLASNEKEAQDYAHRLGKLETVDKVISLHDFVPEDQENKLFLVEELDLLLGPQKHVEEIDSSVSFEEQISALHSLLQKLEVKDQIQESDLGQDKKSEVENKLQKQLRDLILFMKGLGDAVVKEKMISNIEHDLLFTLPRALHAIQKGLFALPITKETLPKDIIERWIGIDGSHRIEAYPSSKLEKSSINRSFVDQVQHIIPDSTGPLVVNLKAGDAVIKAFLQAFASALVIITLLLFFKFRRVKNSLFVILPLASAGIFTVAMMSLTGMSFNFANIIALPLLFGLGVDNGIHMVHSLLKNHETNRVEGSNSTSRGIFYSGITTMCSFGSLAFISHQGMASMGKLLMIGIVLNLLCTLVVLPSFADPYLKNNSLK